ncbi:hypothetical protein NC652_032356 [Populus alba x Populus x berolinensis]|nr:hypothetical protein NC652_032351 [Populus alba x Populus x berolinensis]KAJ6878790.1 hypothetical protein NC652_032355 [Populus alba x Populus x berolinensis]KAJ6878791.1 hypothetical protein NC652_032356 [Populus alba x Populus x berolinensis]
MDLVHARVTSPFFFVLIFSLYF